MVGLEEGVISDAAEFWSRSGDTDTGDATR